MAGDNPFGITQVDVPGLIGIYQGAQDRRVNQMLLQRKIALEDREIAKQEKLSQIYSNIRDPNQGGGGQAAPAGGVAGAYAPTPAGPPANLLASSPNAASAPSAPAGAAPVASAPISSWAVQNAGLVNQLMTIDPAQAAQIAAHFKSLDEAGRAQLHQNAVDQAGLAQELLGLPPGQREAARQHLAPMAVKFGLSPEQVASFPLDDQSLHYAVNRTRDVEAVIKSTQPDIVNVGAGDQLVDKRNPQGGPLYTSPFVKGPDGQVFFMGNGSPAGGAPVTPPASHADAATLRAQAAEAIKNGADPAKVNARLQQMLGGAGSSAPQTFP